MNDRPEPRQPIAAAAGLCDSCRHAALIVNDRGSRFIRCERSRTDPSFAKYPRLPVAACAGYENKPG
jgi:hypothetical protein